MIKSKESCHLFHRGKISLVSSYASLSLLTINKLQIKFVFFKEYHSNFIVPILSFQLGCLGWYVKWGKLLREMRREATPLQTSTKFGTWIAEFGVHFFLVDGPNLVQCKLILGREIGRRNWLCCYWERRESVCMRWKDKWSVWIEFIVAETENWKLKVL